MGIVFESLRRIAMHCRCDSRVRDAPIGMRKQGKRERV
jgi:hypothetical protein